MTDRKSIGPKEIALILAATDAMGLHREAVRVLLEAVVGGRVAIEGDRLVVAAPDTGELDAFVAGLPSRIESLPGAGRLKRAAP